MKTTLAILTATTALAAFLAMPAVGAVHSVWTGDSGQFTGMHHASSKVTSFLLASNDDDDYKSKAGYRSDHDGEDDDDDDDGQASASPAPAGSVAPPANGLFDTGAGSKVQVN
ncbi:hypothetical protein IMCC20628_04648 (plasmid) [Hoeflea sp. IMCC20628]|uniref:hypothetical protein n=1 Tax=Hoeflea sp. IMCC20628 TaxID=1620421 RepID=UPI00063AE873|nr:hypothetical protein [Hoeflea sp. IMCC20628]AKI03314.1 hypothetical protein IMCC20628_04648 [Hoeflea sp. IMCC20628]